MSQSLAAELEILANRLQKEESSDPQSLLRAVADKIAKSLGVKPDEVAILAVSCKWKHLHFLVPQALRNVGQIPLSSTSALAARTVRDNRAEIANNFAATRHASVFEGVKSETLSATAIQRMISAPIPADGAVIGVIQISRKGATPAEAGREFTTEDLGKVLAICKPLGRLLEHVNPS